MDEEILDYVLVPLGLLTMAAYHIWLLRQIVRRPNTTVVGINAINRRFWVLSRMEESSKNGVLAVQTLRNIIMASTVLASTAIMLSSSIAVLMTSPVGLPSRMVYGGVSELEFGIKFFSLMVCFLVAFLFIVQSIRHYSHASMLVNVPIGKMGWGDNERAAAEYVCRTMDRGSYFWSLGLRAFYFSFPLFFWIFGPIPMFCSCIVMVFLLYFLDVAFSFGGKLSDSLQKDQCQDDEEANVANN